MATNLQARHSNLQSRDSIISLSILHLWLFCMMILSIHAVSKERTWIGPNNYILNGAPARQGHGFAELDGKLFVFGGFDGSGDLQDFYQFDPSTLSWADLTGETLGDVPSPREAHGFLSESGMLYAFGGRQSNVFYNDLLQFYPSTFEWTLIQGTGTIPTPRSGFGFTSCNGLIFVFGGYDGTGLLNDFFVFDTSTLVWTDLTSMASGQPPAPRDGHSITCVDGKVFVFGGWTAKGTLQSDSPGADYFDDLRWFDPATLQWQDLTDQVVGAGPSARYIQGMARLGDKVYIFGGFDGSGVLKDFYMLDTVGLVWTDLTGQVGGVSPPSARYRHRTAATGSRLFLSGGWGSAGFYQDLYEFDHARLLWDDVSAKVDGALPSARALHGLAATAENLYIFAGYDDKGLRDDLYAVDLTKMTCTNLTGTPGLRPSARSGHGFVAVDGRLYVFGGGDGSAVLNDLYVFEPSTLTWVDLTGKAIGAAPAPRDRHGFATEAGKLFVFGGYDGAGVLNDVHSLDLSTLEWTELTDQLGGDIPAARSGHGLAAINGRLFTFAGDTGSSFTGLLKDFRMLDLATLLWSDLTDRIPGIPLTARYDHSFSLVDGRLAVFGGSGGSGIILQNLNTLVPPSRMLWPEDSGVDHFIAIYDWDVVMVTPENSPFLGARLNLCGKIFPCALHIMGQRGGIIRKRNDGSISCLAGLGCERLVLDSIAFVCEEHVAVLPVLDISGSELSVYNSSFNGCSSSVDGSIIRSFAGAKVSVHSSVFNDVHSLGTGGAITVVGGVLNVQDSSFVNCSSLLGGGAISATDFHCYGSTAVITTTAKVSSSAFEFCSSRGSGGAIAAIGRLVSADIHGSTFEKCTSDVMGGAVSVSSSASMTVSDSIFTSNAALGEGGGAVNAQYATLKLKGVIASDNTAFSGGGGALYWVGKTQPNISLWCGPGSYAMFEAQCTPDACTPSCAKCSAGTYQSGKGSTACLQCSAGTFSVTQGSSTAEDCISCAAGTFSTGLGLQSIGGCVACGTGTYSSPGGSACQSCAAGKVLKTYFDKPSTCIGCEIGKYSNATNSVSSCVLCEPGKYADASGASTCLLCRVGKYSTAWGATSHSRCIDCLPGTHSDVEGASSVENCVACPKGTYSQKKYYSFQMVALPWVDAEAACVASGGHLASVQSEEENQQVLASVPTDGYYDFWLGYYFNTTVGRWMWSDGTESIYSNWAAMNPKTGSQKYLCTDFPVYSYPTQNATAWPYLEEQYGQITAYLPESIPAATWYTYDCQDAFLWVNGYICSYTGASSCIECAVGKYSATLGASSSDSCSDCNVGKYADHLGATMCTACTTEVSSTIGGARTCNGSDAVHRTAPGKISQSFNPNLERISMLSSKDGFSDAARTIRGEVRERRQVKIAPVVNLMIVLKYDGLFRGYSDIQENSTLKAISKIRRRAESKTGLHLCGPGNAAAYGPCLASSYFKLEVSNLPKDISPAYPGISFSVDVQKLDAYGQTIYADSTSLLEVLTSVGGTKVVDAEVHLSGTSVVKLEDGHAQFSLVVKPSYASVNPTLGTTELKTEPYIFVKGTDSLAEDALDKMESEVYEIPLSEGSQVCPIGFILALDQSMTGSCTKCGPGTYSINPLAGNTFSAASCLNCPAGAVGGSCLGGSAIQFDEGRWAISGGSYKLVGCPAGYQLVNAINGMFSHDIQQCLKCKTDEYILNSSSSIFSCQRCPVGAVCDGSTLVGRVNGSLWIADMDAGIYVLRSCPPGYVLENANTISAECSLCPAEYYCVGGSAPMVACPEATFSPAGATGIAACIPAVFVRVAVLLPISKDQFTLAEQGKFLSALAVASGVSEAKVLLKSVTATRRSDRADGFVLLPTDNGQNRICILERFTEGKMGSPDLKGALTNCWEADAAQNPLQWLVTDNRRATSGSIQVISMIAADSLDTANALSKNLNSASLNSELALRGLPPCTLNSITVQATSVPQSNSGTPVAIAVGVALGGFVFLLFLSVVGTFMYLKIRKHAAHVAFLTALRNAKSGEKASPDNLPLQLRTIYEAQQVVGRGAFGCVVSANSKQGSRAVAIKLIIPEKGIFDAREMRQLSREGQVLEIFTRSKCEHAVQLSGHDAVRIQPDMCWFVMELLKGEDMESVIRDKTQGPISDLECIKAGRNVLAALKWMHTEGMVHRDIKPANIMRCRGESDDEGLDGHSYTYKLVDFGTALGIDESIARETMMTISSNRQMGAGTLPYMSPEMFKEPENASYQSDLWSLGVTMFEFVTGCLPFEAESDLLLSLAVAGDMNQKAPDVLDKLGEDRRANFDNNLAKVIGTALEKHVQDRFQSVDEMHEALYSCLINRNEACYSVFVSYRVTSEAPFARLLFDELNHSVTPGGHRVTVYWDARRLVKGEDWEESFATGLLNSLCFFPLLSYGFTAPLAELPPSERADLLASGWDEEPCGRPRLQGAPTDREDNVLKELLIAATLLDRRAAFDRGEAERGPEEAGMLNFALPILIGRQHPKGHLEYPRMGSFFQVQAGGGRYPQTPSPPTCQAVVEFLRRKAGMPEAVLAEVGARSVQSVVQAFTTLQGCQMWDHPTDLAPAKLTKQQQDLVGTGYAGPAVKLDGVELTAEQRELCRRQGLDEEQLRFVKAQIRHKRSAFHEVIDRAVDARARVAGGVSVYEPLDSRPSPHASRSRTRRGSGCCVTGDIVMSSQAGSVIFDNGVAAAEVAPPRRNTRR